MGIVAASVVAATAGAVVTNVMNQRSSELFLANVEAMAAIEADWIDLCETHCRNYSNYKCILETNLGFEVRCDEMIPWFM